MVDIDPDAKISKQKIICEEISSVNTHLSEISLHGTKGHFLYKWVETSNSHECIQIWNTKSKAKPSFPHEIVNWLVDHIFDMDEMHDQILEFHTEFKRNNVLYHCHPNYRGQGLWQDWVNVLYESERGHIFIPAQIKLLFFAVENNIKKLKVLIHSCVEPPKKYSVLTQQAILEKEYEVVDPESLENHICVFPYDSNSNLILLFLPKESWSEEFSDNNANILPDSEIDDMYDEIQEFDDNETSKSSSDTETSMDNEKTE